MGNHLFHFCLDLAHLAWIHLKEILFFQLLKVPAKFHQIYSLQDQDLLINCDVSSIYLITNYLAIKGGLQQQQSMLIVLYSICHYCYVYYTEFIYFCVKLFRQITCFICHIAFLYNGMYITSIFYTNCLLCVHSQVNPRKRNIRDMLNAVPVVKVLTKLN